MIYDLKILKFKDLKKREKSITSYNLMPTAYSTTAN